MEHANKDEWYQTHYAAKYLIGRWADVKASLDSLTKRARALFIANEVANCEHQIRSYKRQIEDVEHTANSKFGGAMPVTDGLPF